MFQARVTAAVRRLEPGVPFGEGLKLSANMMTAISPDEIVRMMSGKEALEMVCTKYGAVGTDVQPQSIAAGKWSRPRGVRAQNKRPPASRRIAGLSVPHIARAYRHSTLPMTQPDAWRNDPPARCGGWYHGADRQPQLSRDRDYRLSSNGGALEHAQEMAAHESPRTTKLYDRTKERLTQDEVERIRL